MRGACAAAVENVLLRFNNQRYRLAAWVVMPNHVHALVELWEMPMGKLLKAWKGVSANAVNQILDCGGQLWQTEYWDRYMRDEDHFRQAQHYIEWNPVKAGLVKTPETWAFGSANPKWRWSAADRYQGAHLLNGDAGELADQNVGVPTNKECGHSCPPVEAKRKADRNVGAPKRGTA